MSSNESQSIEQQANNPPSVELTRHSLFCHVLILSEPGELPDDNTIDKLLGEYDMSEKGTLSLPEIDQNSREQKYRHSLQPKSTLVETPLRHTKSQNYGAKKKKVSTKAPPPAIPELDSPDDDTVKITIEAPNEFVRVGKTDRKHSKQSSHRGSRKASQASSRIGFDNAAFEPERDGIKFSRNSSAANSVRSLRSSNRDPSVQSLTVVREQYCCCSRYTPCERALFAAVGVLSFIIILLVIAVILVAVENKNGGNVKGLFANFKSLINK